MTRRSDTPSWIWRVLCAIGWHWNVTSRIPASAPMMADRKCELCGREWTDYGW